MRRLRNQNKFLPPLLALACFVVVHGCASPKNLPKERPEDANLTCDEITEAVEKTNHLLRLTADRLGRMDQENGKTMFMQFLFGSEFYYNRGTLTDTDSTINNIDVLASRNVVLAALAARRSCGPVQALTGAGARYEGAKFTPETANPAGNPEDWEPMVKPRMYVVIPKRSDTQPNAVQPSGPRTTKPSLKELMRQFLKGEVTRAEYLKQRDH
jgi:hypothetical protein